MVGEIFRRIIFFVKKKICSVDLNYPFKGIVHIYAVKNPSFQPKLSYGIVWIWKFERICFSLIFSNFFQKFLSRPTLRSWIRNFWNPWFWCTPKISDPRFRKGEDRDDPETHDKLFLCLNTFSWAISQLLRCNWSAEIHDFHGAPTSKISDPASDIL